MLHCTFQMNDVLLHGDVFLNFKCGLQVVSYMYMYSSLLHYGFPWIHHFEDRQVRYNIYFCED